MIDNSADMYWERQVPARAIANIRGGPLAPGIRGTVYFVNVPGGTQVYANISGLPAYKPAVDGRPQVGPHGFHIHKNGDCSPGNAQNPFPNAGEHWNPTGQPHGNHSKRVSMLHNKKDCING